MGVVEVWLNAFFSAPYGQLHVLAALSFTKYVDEHESASGLNEEDGDL
jgi:hypothetical protein